MNRKFSLFTFSALIVWSLSSFAAEEKERIYLTQILNQLNAVKPLIVAAAREQPNMNRIKFHYTTYVDASGKEHRGLLNDINEIEKGIQQKLNNTLVEARNIEPIKGDYFDHYTKKREEA